MPRYIILCVVDRAMETYCGVGGCVIWSSVFFLQPERYDDDDDDDDMLSNRNTRVHTLVLIIRKIHTPAAKIVFIVYYYVVFE